MPGLAAAHHVFMEPVIFGILAGGQIAGIPGIFFSVPVLATLRIEYRQLKKKLLNSTFHKPGIGIV